MKPLVIYHDHCTDGFGAAYAAWTKFGDHADYLPKQYGPAHPADIIELVQDRDVYVLDFSFPEPIMQLIVTHAAHLTWLDHHKTAFENWSACGDERNLFVDEDDDITIRLDNNASGALLAWQYFQPTRPAPMVIQHIDDRDRWQWQLPHSKEVHAAIQSMQPWSFELWEDDVMSASAYGYLVRNGKALVHMQDQQVAASASKACTCNVLGVPGLAVNCPVNISEVGHQLTKKSGTYGLVWYFDSATKRANCSLRSEGDFDVSAMARQFGGGGHKNAAGFNVSMAELLEMVS